MCANTIEEGGELLKSPRAVRDASSALKSSSSITSERASPLALRTAEGNAVGY